MQLFCCLINHFDNGEFLRMLLEKDITKNMVKAQAWDKFTKAYIKVALPYIISVVLGRLIRDVSSFEFF